MVTLTELWQPILLSGVLVWIVSAIIWMVMPHHKSDFKALPDEDAARKALTPQNLTPGVYSIPHVESPEAAKQPENEKLFNEGPVGFLTIVPQGVPAMGGKIFQSFIFFIDVSILVAYVVGRTLALGTDYLTVFRVAGTTAWLAYGWGIIPSAIWFGKPWSHVIKDMIDALVYALLTAGAFGWLFPRVIAS